MNKPVSAADLVTPKVTTGPLAGSRKIYVDARRSARPARAAARDRAVGGAPASRRCRSTTPPAPTPTTTSRSTSRRACKRTRIEWVKERGGVEEYDGRPIKPVDNGNVTRQAPRAQLPQHAEAVARARRQARHPIRMGQGRRHHQGNDLRRRAREHRPQDSSSTAPKGALATARASAPSVPLFITPEFVR